MDFGGTNLECWNVSDETVPSHLSSVVSVGQVSEAPGSGGMAAVWRA